VLSSGIKGPIIEWVDVVKEPTYLVYKNESKKHATLRAIYRIKGTQTVSTYVCLDHPVGSRARKIAETWWANRSSLPCPNSCWEAYHLLKKVPHALAAPKRMHLKWIPGRKWPEILAVEIGEIVDCSNDEAVVEARELAEIQLNLFNS
jgi:hypothetical protein